MNQLNRQEEILNLVQQGKCTSVKELQSFVYASAATIRRDLHELESKGLIRLLYGLIVPISDLPRELPLAFRENEAKTVKRLLAKHAVSMIPPGATVMLDASSSTVYMADYISADSEITVFTNCIKTAVKLCEKGVTVYLIGGRIDSRNFVAEGAWTEASVRSVNVDYFFFSSKAMDEEGIITGVYEPGVEIRKHMISHAKHQFFICNAEKVGKRSTFTLCRASDITGVITDALDRSISNVNIIEVRETV